MVTGLIPSSGARLDLSDDEAVRRSGIKVMIRPQSGIRKRSRQHQVSDVLHGPELRSPSPLGNPSMFLELRVPSWAWPILRTMIPLERSATVEPRWRYSLKG